MNFKETINTILEVARNHKMVNEVGYGDIYEHLNSGEHKYPLVFLTVDSVELDLTTNNSINFTLFYVDMLMDDNSNKLDIQSFAITTLEKLTNELNNILGGVEPSNVTLFTEKFTDLCAGGYLQLKAGYADDDLC